ncbi:MAG: XdhC family protein [Blautia wexlerae]
MANGIPEADLARVHAPIGLEIYGQTPAEIAVSVAAEMIRHRALRAGTDKKPSKG